MATLFKNLELEFAKAASHDPEMDRVAALAESYVVGLAPVERGDFVHSIKRKTVRTPRGVRDRLIYSENEGAMSIEFGYMSRAGNWIPGHFAFTRAKDAFR